MTTETPRWLTSSYSSNGGSCVKVAINLAGSRGVVPVCDSKVQAGPVLDFSASAFSSFVQGVASGRLGIR